MHLFFFQKRHDHPDHQDSVRKFERDGFLVCEGFFEHSQCDRISGEAEAYYARQNVPVGRVERTMNAHQECPTARKVLAEPRLLDLLHALLGEEPTFLQSIYFHRGSQQPVHSDYIYMSTEPSLQLCGVWIACEDVAAEAGPLTYYPGSHKIPIDPVPLYFERNIDSIHAEIERDLPALEARYGERMKMTGESLLGCYFYDRWLGELSDSLERGGYRASSFMPKKGDMIIWHANLAHGGTGIKDAARSRKSLVAHYLTTAVRKYYDMNYVNHKNWIDPKFIDHNRPATLQSR